MRTIDAAIVTALRAGTLRAFSLVEFNIDGTQYLYTDCDVPLKLGSVRYEPRAFKVDRINYSMNTIVDSVQLKTDNLDDALTVAFVEGTPQRSGVAIRLAIFDSSYDIIGSPLTVFEGLIDDWALDEVEVTMTVSSLLTAWSQRALAKHSPSCRWKKFKSKECGYSGTENWCDRSYVRCAALSNTDNYGGFRWLPSIETKEIWWGRSKHQ